MRLENVKVPLDSHLAELYSVELDDKDIKEASPAFADFVRSVIPGANALTIRRFTRTVRRVYAG